jgi:hypothetical protein
MHHNVRGVSYPLYAIALKEQNDAFHASWHTTDLNTLIDPNINVRGVPYPSHIIAPKGQNDAFHVS